MLQNFGPIGLRDIDGLSRTDSIGSTRLGPKSVRLGRSRSGPDRGCASLAIYSGNFYIDPQGTWNSSSFTVIVNDTFPHFFHLV
jgi:hypothetical protein